MILYFVFIFYSLNIIAQSNFENGEIVLHNSTVIKGKILYLSLIDLQSGVKFKNEKINKFFPIDSIKSISIGDDQRFEKLQINKKDQMLQMLNDGAMKLYLSHDEWLYASKDDEPLTRLELHVMNANEKNSRDKSIDTLKRTKLGSAGTYIYVKKYLHYMQSRFEGSFLKMNPKINLSVKNMKNLVSTYNSTRSDVPSKKYFSSNSTLFLMLGYGTSHFLKEDLPYSGMEYYVEIQNSSLSRYISFFASHRPYIKIDKEKFTHTNIGFRVFPFTVSYFTPYISVGSQFYKFEQPSAMIGLGLKTKITNKFNIVFDVYELPFKNYRIGLEGGIRI